MTDAPASASTAQAPFAFIAPDHPMAPRLERFRAAVAAHGDDAAGATVHADLSLRADPRSGLVLHRAYRSAQTRGPDGFRATTLDYRAARDRATWLEFPEDPRLPALAAFAGPGASVLRYMPLRRCTARLDGAIAKVKRAHRAAEAWDLLRAVHGALGDGRAGFAVPAPLAYDAASATSSQTALAGEDLSDLIDAETAPALLRHAGALHRAMHAARVPGVPAEDPEQALAETRADALWVAVALPEHAAAVREVLEVLERHVPGPPAAPAFCHGDLVPSQMLVAGERWAITDFDGARAGDPHRDLAVWLAALAFDVPALRASAEAGDHTPLDRAEAAYLDGYGAHDERRLRWHRAVAEVHALAVDLKKDRHHPARFARGLASAVACAEAIG